MRLITYNHQYCRDLGRGVGVILGHIDNTYYMYNTQKIMTFLFCEKPHESKITQVVSKIEKQYFYDKFLRVVKLLTIYDTYC